MKNKVLLLITFLLINFIPATVCFAQTSVVLDGNNIRSGNVNGFTFKGFGVLSANGTSALLMDYKSGHPDKYAELLKVLFGGTNPVITHVKIEMGNDRNNSTGPDPATMRSAGETANVKRHPGFQLAADAKKVNPGLKVSILRWNSPGWVTGNDNVYTWYKNTILAAYRNYGYMVDYVNPGLNERTADLTWTRQFADRIKSDNSGFNSTVERGLFNSIRTVISDEVQVGSFGGSMVNDSTLRSAVSVAAYHYNTDDDSAGNFKKLAEQFDKEIWNSEAQATFSNSSFRPNNNMRDPSVAGTGIGGTSGPLEMGNTIIKGFVNSRRTHFVYQPAIGSFYEGGQYSFKELLSARDPWSGWIHFDAGLVILRHFSWFAETGWENQSNNAGIWRGVPESSYTGATGTNPVNGRNGTPSYMTLAAPDKKNFSTVFINDSEYTKNYTLQTLNMGYTGYPSLELWETRAADTGKAFNSNYMKYLGNISANASGVYSITVKPFSVVTVSTLTNHEKAEFNTPLPVEGARIVLDTDATGSFQNTADNILYADNFDYTSRTVPVIGAGGQITGTESYVNSRGGSKSVIPRFTCDRNGAFEAYLPDGSNNYILRQQVDQSVMGLGGTWNNGNPITGIGDFRWLNYKASVDVSFENNSTQGGDNYAAIGARQQGGGNSHYMNGTPYFLKFWFDGGWMLKIDGTTVADGNVVSGSGGVTIPGFNRAYNAWHNLAIEVVENRVTAYLDGIKLASYTDPKPRLSGRIDLASGYYYTRFDNLKVETVSGYIPYYSELLDNLEMHDLASVPAPRLIYGGSWAHANGKSMYNYQRSLSTSQGTGSTLRYSFHGTGLDILGPNNGSAVLEVTVDGQVVSSSAPTAASGEFFQTYTLRGLPYGEHTVTFKVLSGTLVVDAVAVVPSLDPGQTPEPTPEPTPTPTPNHYPIWSGGPYVLDGIDDYVSLPGGLTNGLGDFSIACRVKLNSLDSWSRIFDFGEDTNVYMMLTAASGVTGNPHFAITISSNTGEQGIRGNAPLPTGSWQHLAVTKQGTTGILYVNGVEAGRNSGISLSPSSLGSIRNNYIGRSQWSSDPCLNGSVDKFVVYNRALSPSEVSALAVPSVLGDVNGNGVVDIVDALLTAQYYVGLDPAGFIPENADVNCSGSIDILDALLIAQFYVGLITGFLC